MSLIRCILIPFLVLLVGCASIDVNKDYVDIDKQTAVEIEVVAPIYRRSSVTASICNGDSIVINGTTYNASNPSGTEVFTVGPNNCDSTVRINLNVLAAIDIAITSLSPMLTANQAGATYRWLDCDNGNTVIPAETNQSYIATTNGNYAVEITIGSCIDTSACENISNVGVNDFDFGNNITIYPNPTNDKFSVKLGNLKDVTISIVTPTGEEVYNKNEINDAQVEISLNELSNGLYFVRIQSNEQQKVMKVIKQ
jgi:hypothetical protein